MTCSGQTRQATVLDTLALIAVTLLSAAPYVARLGFYSDDWDILGRFDAAAAQGRWPIAAIQQVSAARPVGGLYAAALYETFGRDPLGYHFVNTTVLAASVSLFYLLLARLRVGRAKAFAAALLFVALPQLSTIRVWFATFQVTLSLLLALVSLHAQLSFARSGKMRWAALAVLAAALSLAAYEIFVPLLAGFAIALAVAASRKRGVGTWRSMVIVALVMAILALALAFKMSTSSRAGALTHWDRYVAGAWQMVRPDYDWRVDSSLNVFAAIDVHFWRVAAGWGSAVADLATGRLPLLAVAASAAAAAMAFWRLRSAPAGESRSVRLLLLGAAAFVLGHALFLIVPAIVFTPTGMGNRVLVATALGVAMIFAGVMAMAARAISEGERTTAFAIFVAVASFLGFLRLSTIEAYWAETPALQRSVLESARRDLASVPAGSTVILDGLCPYHGPAVVFETSWDTGPALSFALNRPVMADVVSPRTRITSSGIETSIYKQPASYPFGPRLFAYDVRRHLVSPLPDRAAAHDYVARGVPV